MSAEPARIRDIDQRDPFKTNANLVQEGYYSEQYESWKNRPFADATISCSSSAWTVDRAILSAHSDFLRSAFSNGMRESKEKHVDLDAEEEPEFIELMLEFIYTQRTFAFPCTNIANAPASWR